MATKAMPARKAKTPNKIQKNFLDKSKAKMKAANKVKDKAGMDAAKQARAKMKAQFKRPRR